MKNLVREWLLRRRQRNAAALRERCLKYAIENDACANDMIVAYTYEQYIKTGKIIVRSQMWKSAMNEGRLPGVETLDD